MNLPVNHSRIAWTLWLQYFYATVAKCTSIVIFSQRTLWLWFFSQRQCELLPSLGVCDIQVLWSYCSRDPNSLLVHRFYILFIIFRIGFAIARRLGEDGAKVVVSSRKQQNVDKAVKALQKENLDVCGVVCHVGKKEDRSNLIQKVC